MLYPTRTENALAEKNCVENSRAHVQDDDATYRVARRTRTELNVAAQSERQRRHAYPATPSLRRALPHRRAVEFPPPSARDGCRCGEELAFVSRANSEKYCDKGFSVRVFVDVLKPYCLARYLFWLTRARVQRCGNLRARITTSSREEYVRIYELNKFPDSCIEYNIIAR